MITYVQCLSSEPVVSCWHRACYEDPAEKLPPRTPTKMGNSLQLQLQASGPVRPEGSVLRRLLSVKVHQRQDSLWTPKPLLGPVTKGSPGHTYTYKDGKGRTSSSSLGTGDRWGL